MAQFSPLTVEFRKEARNFAELRRIPTRTAEYRRVAQAIGQSVEADAKMARLTQSVAQLNGSMAQANRSLAQTIRAVAQSMGTEPGNFDQKCCYGDLRCRCRDAPRY